MSDAPFCFFFGCILLVDFSLGVTIEGELLASSLGTSNESQDGCLSKNLSYIDNKMVRCDNFLSISKYINQITTYFSFLTAKSD